MRSLDLLDPAPPAGSSGLGLGQPPGAATDWTVPQDWSCYTAEEHAVWDLLFARQQQALAGRAVADFGRGLDLLRLSHPGIPDFDELNERLFARTGWTVVAVPGLVPDDIFFDHLRKRRFPAGNFIRRRSQIDYLEEPDVFHDVFGHVPLLSNPDMAEAMQLLGERGLEALAAGVLPILSRLYWYTVEFGLSRAPGGHAIYGAGIVSSYGESLFALESPVPPRLPFDLRTVLATPYRSDAFQERYFVVEDLREVIDAVGDAGLIALCRAAADAERASAR